MIGLPLGLNMYENLFFWEAFFRNLDFDIVVSDLSSRALYAKGSIRFRRTPPAIRQN